MRGRYRVTLNGFTAQRQSLDNLFQTDGGGDEIYFATYVAEIDTSSSDLLKHWVVTSRAMGQAGFPDRVKLGSNHKSLGGIRTGDHHRGAGPIARDSLPMLLWEGELVQGQRAVAIVPTVWEWDDNPQLYSYWLVSRGVAIQRLLAPDVLLSALDNRSYFPFDLGAPGLRLGGGLLPDFRDRPIGLDFGEPSPGVVIAADHAATNPGNKGGKNGTNGVAGGLRSIVERILAKFSSAPGLSLFDRHRRDLVDGYEPFLRAVLSRPAPVSRAKSRVDAITPLPWSAAASRDAKLALNRRVDSIKKASPTRVYKSLPLLSLERLLRTVIRNHRARDVFFFEQTFVLTPQAIEAALSQRRKPGIPPGSIDVVYADHRGLQGRYILHLRVERLGR